MRKSGVSSFFVFDDLLDCSFLEKKLMQGCPCLMFYDLNVPASFSCEIDCIAETLKECMEFCLPS